MVLSRAEPEDATTYQLCKRYVDRYRGENNDDITTNGELAFMKQRLAESRVVVDAGANVGDWIALALAVNPGLEVHAFEPSAATFRRLVERGFGSNVRCRNLGLGSRKEERDLFVFEDGSGLNSLYRRAGLEAGWGLNPQSREERVQIQTLDQYCATQDICRIDYLKIDVEGHELEVFRGAAGMLAECRIRCIQFEYGGCNIDSGVRLKDIFEFFEDYGYRFFKIHPDGPRPVERYDQRLENYQYQNWALTTGE